MWEGKLTAESLRHLLETVKEQNLMGTIYVSDGVTEKIFYFSIGGVRLIVRGKMRCRSTEEILLEMGALTEEQLERIRALQEEKKAEGKQVRLSDLIREQGVVDRETWQKACQVRLEEELTDLLTWHGAEYKFSEGNPPEDFYKAEYDAVSATFHLGKFLEKIRRESQHFQLVEATFSSDRIVLEPTGKKALIDDQRESHQISARERKVLELIDGEKSLRELHKQLEKELSRKQLYEIVFSLMRKGFVKKVDPTHQKKLIRKQVEEEIRTLEGSLEQAVDKLRLCEKLAALYEEIGEKEKAKEYYTQIARELERKDPNKALFYYEKAEKGTAEDIPVQNRMLKLYLDTGNQGKAFSLAYRLAKYFVSMGLFRKAAELYKLLVQLKPEDVRVREERAHVLLKLHNEQEALKELKEAAKHAEQKKNIQALERIASLIRKIGEDATPIQRQVFALKGEWWKALLFLVPPKKVIQVVFVLAVLLVGGVYIYQFLRTSSFEEQVHLSAQYLKKGKVQEAKQVLLKLRKEYGASYEEEVQKIQRQFQKLEQWEKNKKVGEKFAQALALENTGQILQALKLWREILTTGDPAFQEVAKRQVHRLEKLWQNWKKEKREYERKIQKLRFLTEKDFQWLEKTYRRLERFTPLELPKPLLIRSFPKGALVYLDGNFQGRTPLRFLVKNQSSLKLRLKKRGYQTLETTLSLRKFVWDFSLRPKGEVRTLPVTVFWGEASQKGGCIALLGGDSLWIFSSSLWEFSPLTYGSVFSAVFSGNYLWVSTQKGLFCLREPFLPSTVEQVDKGKWGILLAEKDRTVWSYSPKEKKLILWEKERDFYTYPLSSLPQYLIPEAGLVFTEGGIWKLKGRKIFLLATPPASPVGPPLFTGDSFFYFSRQGIALFSTEGTLIQSESLKEPLLQVIPREGVEVYALLPSSVELWELNQGRVSLQTTRWRKKGHFRKMKATSHTLALWDGKQVELWQLKKKIGTQEFEALPLARFLSHLPPLLFESPSSIKLIMGNQIWDIKK